MKAAVLNAFGKPRGIERVEDPVLGTGEVLVDVVAAPVLSYTNEVLSGARHYLLVTPVVPGAGAIGRVRAVGPDATRLEPGEGVFCDPTVRGRDGAPTPDITLQGVSVRGEGKQKPKRYFRDGTFAERVRVPTEKAAPIGAIDPAEAGHWTAVTTLLIAYGGFPAMEFRSGETLLVSDATGNFGSATVAPAMAMGARCVVAPGRNVAALDDLRRRFGPRLAPVRLTGDGETDTEAMRAAAPGPIDAVQDFPPPSVDATVTRTAIMSLRQGGRAVLMGGMGMLGGADLSLPYPRIMRNLITVRGQWMYDVDAIPGLISLIRGGLLDLDHSAVTAFPLDGANDAVAHAAAHAGPFRLTVIVPWIILRPELSAPPRGPEESRSGRLRTEASPRWRRGRHAPANGP